MIKSVGDVNSNMYLKLHLVCRVGTTVSTQVYDKDGKQIDDDGTTIGSKNPFRYRGYYWDREFGLYYLQSRYYDPALGRFISPDGIDYLDPSSINGMNLYAYCGNDPVKRSVYYNTALGSLLSPYGIKSTILNNARISLYPFSNYNNIIAGKIGNTALANYFTQAEISVDVWGVDSILWGRFKYSVSSVLWKSAEKKGVFYAYESTINNNIVSVHAGINLYDWLGVDIGVSKGNGDYSVSIGANITPWFHIGVSVGLSGITLTMGAEYNGKSHDVSIGIGLATVAVAVGVAVLILSGGTVWDWIWSLFSEIFG